MLQPVDEASAQHDPPLENVLFAKLLARLGFRSDREHMIGPYRLVIPEDHREGNPEFLPYLERNVESLGCDIELEASFVADDDTRILLADIDTEGGTASVNRAVRATTQDSGSPALSLSTIVRKHPRFAAARLLKIDTDGLDFRIEPHLVYDNFGTFLITIEAPQRFAELNAYLRSNRKHGRAVYYFDVCSFHDIDSDLFERVREEDLHIATA
jgi:hypothetical protein